MMNKLRTRLKENKKKKLINKMMGLLDFTDVGLGRKSREYLNSINDKTRSLTKAVVIAGTTVALILFFILFIIDNSNALVASTCVFLATVFLGIDFILALCPCWNLVNNRGPIGKVVKELNNWKGFYYDIVHPFLLRILTVLPFMKNISKDRLVALDEPKDWSDDELGRFMRLAISCAAISVNADYDPTDEVIDRFLGNVKAEETVNDILDTVVVRRFARIEAEKRHEECRKSREYAERDAKSASMADILQERLIKEHPDGNNVDFNRINDLYVKLNDKTKELRTNIVERSNQ